MNVIRDVRNADQVLSKYRIKGDIYLLGALSSGVTVYRQQVRAHNLAYAAACSKLGEKIKRVAIVGGGVSGLTVTAGLMSLLPSLEVCLFEKRWDLCPLQQGAETRWLHPNIYDWPEEGSRAPGADLPLLSWVEGTASDVVHEILQKFGDFCAWTPKAGKPSISERLSIYIGVSHLSIDANSQKVDWLGRRGKVTEGFVSPGDSYGSSESFDAIVVASGFGVETKAAAEETPSYWRNDTFGQPILTGAQRVFLISGYGDGAIVDLCRLTIERFQHARILQDLLGPDSFKLEEDLRNDPGFRKSFKEFVLGSTVIEELLERFRERIRPRLRKDVVVIVHGAGFDAKNRTIWDLLSGKSSFLNKLLLYGLFRLGAFILRFDDLESVAREFDVPSKNRILRYGTQATEEVLRLFVEPNVVSSRLTDMKNKDEQSTDRLWEPGSFPYVPRRRL